ncbi:MAG TPA: MFS transporter [Candidatus Baltobacteraceae bacterium]|nr:MFS transporter [Candidatus Baltobacteraceae bacterium]
MVVRLPCENQPSSRVQSPQRDVRTAAWVLTATILGSAMPAIDGTAVNVALPILQREMHAGSQAIQWVFEGYSLFLSALILVGGSLGDHVGRRRMFLLGVVVFAAASLGCAIAQTIDQLIAARCIQGIGGALLVPESLALITASFDERHLGGAIGTWSGFLAAAMALGPLLGGWLAQAVSWRLVFVINLPIALVVFAVTLRYAGESRDEQIAGRIDWLGAAIATAALGLLTYGCISLQGARIDELGLAAVLAGLALLGVFVYVEHRSTAPMIPLGIFASTGFTVANVYTLLLYAGLGGALFFVPFNLINVQHYTPVGAGAALLPMIVLMFVSSRWSGGLVARTGARVPLALGALAAGFGFALFGFTGIGGSYWSTFFPAVILLGIGTSTFVAPLTTTVMSSAPSAHAGSASGINNAVSRVAGLIAVALFGILIVVSSHNALLASDRGLPRTVRTVLEADSLLSGRAPSAGIPQPLRGQAGRAVNEAYEIGFRNAMLASAALAWLAAALAWVVKT